MDALLTFSREVEHGEGGLAEHHLLHDDGEAVDIALSVTSSPGPRTSKDLRGRPQEI